MKCKILAWEWCCVVKTKPWSNKNLKSTKLVTMQSLLYVSSTDIIGNCWPPTGIPQLASLGTASQHQSLVVRWEETCAVGTPSECGCSVHQWASQAPSSGKDPFNISSKRKIQEKFSRESTEMGNFTTDTTFNWELSERSYLQVLESFENDWPLNILHCRILTRELEIASVYHLKVEWLPIIYLSLMLHSNYLQWKQWHLLTLPTLQNTYSEMSSWEVQNVYIFCVLTQCRLQQPWMIVESAVQIIKCSLQTVHKISMDFSLFNYSLFNDAFSATQII
jgi:hypothetical protein